MRLLIINGQNHEGSTNLVARKVAGKLKQRVDDCEIREFFLPKDFNEPCLGCYGCFEKSIDACPHYEKLEPIREAILEADVLILNSPVYVYHATGQMMSLLDHFGTWWVVHRLCPEMTKKQALVISTAAGGGMKSACRDMADSLQMWGLRKVYRLGLAVQASRPDDIPERIKNSIEKKTDKMADKLAAGLGKRGINLRCRKWFYLMRLAQKHFDPMEPDHSYWQEQGWLGSARPWK